jgi:hypothetical protein
MSARRLRRVRRATHSHADPSSCDQSSCIDYSPSSDYTARADCSRNVCACAVNDCSDKRARVTDSACHDRADQCTDHADDSFACPDDCRDYSEHACGHFADYSRAHNRVFARVLTRRNTADSADDNCSDFCDFCDDRDRDFSADYGY